MLFEYLPILVKPTPKKIMAKINMSLLQNIIFLFGYNNFLNSCSHEQANQIIVCLLTASHLNCILNHRINSDKLAFILQRRSLNSYQCIVKMFSM